MGVGIRTRGTVNTTIKDCVVYNSNVSMRVGIGTSGWGTSDRIASGSSITIKGTTVGGSGQGVSAAGIRLRGAADSSNIRATIGGNGVNDGNTISHNGEVGILLVDIDEVSIENNEISNNSAGGILLVDSSTVSPHIKDNNIHHQASAAGINIGGASSVTIGDNNNIYANRAGIAFYVANNGAEFSQLDPITKTKSSQPVTITGNNIFSNTEAGIAVRDGISGVTTITQNNIYSNTTAGIRMQRSCTLYINRNDIHDNLRGGIHTGSYQGEGAGFIAGHIGLGFLAIEKNKIYSNGAGGYGAGIDVRHMPGTIYNNLVYNNYKGGIRFGDYITEIINNTVAGNGNATGGGIAYDDLAGAVNANAAGAPPAPLLIRNNISVYNVSAGIRACFDNVDYADAKPYRDHNLLYDNFGCAASCARRCEAGQLGKWTADGSWYCPYASGFSWAPSDICGLDPLFKASDDYRLQRISEGDSADSPAINAGDDNLDMGAYGGSDPLDW
jgi:parallel beta-helix repeat protein